MTAVLTVELGGLGSIRTVFHNGAVVIIMDSASTWVLFRNEILCLITRYLGLLQTLYIEIVDQIIFMELLIDHQPPNPDF